MNIYSYLLTILFLTLGMAGASFADNVQPPDTAPQTGKEYAQRKMKEYAESFNELSGCITELIVVENENDPKKWQPDQMYICEPQLADFEKKRIDFSKNPNLTWDNPQEEKKAFEQAELLNQIHQPMLRIFNFLIRGLGRDSSARKAMVAYFKILSWYEANGEKYKAKLKEIDKLLMEYSKYKEKGKMVNGHFECDSSSMRGMESVVKKLADYIDYNVDTKTLRGMKNGVFLYDLDAHSTKLAKNIKRCLSLVNMARVTTDNLFKNFMGTEGVKQLQKVDKNDLMYPLADQMPKKMNGLISRVLHAFDLILERMTELADGKSTEGKFLTQKDIGEYSHFTSNSYYSFINSIRNSCTQTLLRTKDKHGRDIKHSTHGGQFPPYLNYPPL